MCGRLVVYNAKNDTNLTLIGQDIALNYNACPGEFLPIIRLNPKYHDKELVMALWGKFSPEDKKIYPNIRKDYLTTRNRFWQYRHQHCIVPAGAFYEWDQNVAKGVKKPAYLVHTLPKDVFFIAGLWWEFQQGDDVTTAFTLFTSKPHPVLADIHHRSPVILTEHEQEQWLSLSYEKSEHLIDVYKGELAKYLVDNKIVNNARNKGVDCLLPYSDLNLI